MVSYVVVIKVCKVVLLNITDIITNRNTLILWYLLQNMGIDSIVKNW